MVFIGRMTFLNRWVLLEVNHPDVQNKLSNLVEKINSTGKKTSGTIATDLETLNHYRNIGVKYILYLVDCSVLKQAYEIPVNSLRQKTIITMKTVLIPDHVSSEVKVEKKILGDDYQIICYHNQDEHISESDWKTADGIILWHHINLNEDLINKINNCKVIVRLGSVLIMLILS